MGIRTVLARGARRPSLSAAKSQQRKGACERSERFRRLFRIAGSRCFACSPRRYYGRRETVLRCVRREQMTNERLILDPRFNDAKTPRPAGVLRICCGPSSSAAQVRQAAGRTGGQAGRVAGWTGGGLDGRQAGQAAGWPGGRVTVSLGGLSSGREKRNSQIMSDLANALFTRLPFGTLTMCFPADFLGWT